jgi:hypothetical protein
MKNIHPHTTENQFEKRLVSESQLVYKIMGYPLR